MEVFGFCCKMFSGLFFRHTPYQILDTIIPVQCNYWKNLCPNQLMIIQYSCIRAGIQEAQQMLRQRNM